MYNFCGETPDSMDSQPYEMRYPIPSIRVFLIAGCSIR